MTVKDILTALKSIRGKMKQQERVTFSESIEKAFDKTVKASEIYKSQGISDPLIMVENFFNTESSPIWEEIFANLLSDTLSERYSSMDIIGIICRKAKS